MIQYYVKKYLKFYIQQVLPAFPHDTENLCVFVSSTRPQGFWKSATMTHTHPWTPAWGGAHVQWGSSKHLIN